MAIFGWDEYCGFVYEIGHQIDDDWEVQRTDANGVVVLRDERNGLAFQVEAEREEAAQALLAATPEWKEWHGL